MKWLDRWVHGVDVEVDRTMKWHVWIFVQRYFALFSASLLTLLLVIFLWRVMQNRPFVLSDVITSDLTSIEKILASIDKDCNILSIRTDRATLDFLTVEKFAGSTIGCLNLAYPERWKGPYLQVNPTIQEKFYEIVHAYDGFFVIPGNGVTLPNGLVMGKDIVITGKTPVKPMLQSGGKLVFKERALGFKISFKIGDWDSPRLDSKTVEQVNKYLKEFNEALPYANANGVQAPVCA